MNRKLKHTKGNVFNMFPNTPDTRSDQRLCSIWNKQQTVRFQDIKSSAADSFEPKKNKKIKNLNRIENETAKKWYFGVKSFIWEKADRCFLCSCFCCAARTAPVTMATEAPSYRWFRWDTHSSGLGSESTQIYTSQAKRTTSNFYFLFLFTMRDAAEGADLKCMSGNNE